MYRIGNTLSYGLRKVLFPWKIYSNAKTEDDCRDPYSFVRKEYEIFKETAFWWRRPTVLTGPSRCGKTTLINQYFQEHPSWYIIKNDQKILEDCGMDIAKSFAVAYNNHLENLAKIYEDPDIPKSPQDKWNINKYLFINQRIKLNSADHNTITRYIHDAITTHHNIFNGEELFTILLDDFDSINLANGSKYITQLLTYFRQFEMGGFAKNIFIGKNPYLIFLYLRNKIKYDDVRTVSLGFLSKSDMMNYLKEKKVPLTISEKIYECFGGDIDAVSQLLTYNRDQNAWGDIQIYLKRILSNDLKYMKAAESSLTSEESDILREVYKKLLKSVYMDYENYADKNFQSVVYKSIARNMLSARFVHYISDENGIANSGSVIRRFQ